MLIDHISLAVTDVERALRFYDPVMAALGYAKQFAKPHAFGYALPDDPPEQDRFALLRRPSVPAGDGVHLAFVAPSQAAVDAFYAAAMANGGTDNGAPGTRWPQYYAAFVRDPDGNYLEAVHRSAAPAPTPP